MNTLTNFASGAPCMSSLMIAEITGKDHKHVLADIRRILSEAQIEGAGFLAPLKMPSGQVATVYSLPRFECDLVISGYSVKYRAAIIKRWHELESQQPFQLPQTMAEALRLAADLSDTVAQQQAALSIAAPKVEFYDRVTESSDVCQLAVAAQVAKLPFGRNTLFQKLRELGVLISGGERHNLPKQEFIKRGLFTVNERKFEKPDSGEPVISFTTYATQKGIEFIVSKFGGGKELA